MRRHLRGPEDAVSGPRSASQVYAFLRDMILRVTVKANIDGQTKDARDLVSLHARAARAGKFGDLAQHIADRMNQHEAETSSWVDAERLALGLGGAFDACDLRHWLALASRAQVPAIPAREILCLSEEEMAVASGEARLPRGRALGRVQAAAKKLVSEAAHEDEPASDGTLTAEVDPLDVQDKLFAAMDDVPEGWMVRHALCGHSTLKALAGTGLAGSRAPEVRFGADLEVGPGWVRLDNRRMVDTKDARVLRAAVQGRVDAAGVFLARPWMQASRWLVGEDPHRHGSPFAGKGCWPAEWRAFVEDGTVVGVASYYGWVGDVTPLSVTNALEVRRLAQKIADEAVAQKAYPRHMDFEFYRTDKVRSAIPGIAAALKRYGREMVAFTLDFIETDQGLLLLEGGPAHTAMGGGHPCAFAGCGGRPVLGNQVVTEGVAFRTMPQVFMAEPSTWEDGDRTGCISTWAEAERLAIQSTLQPNSVTS